ncbi:MAG: hypothetical protein KDA68_23945 [Planctomycetaceae bacterium]|nr:hypothetical protein [Planctomycetaceae bacterium]
MMPHSILGYFDPGSGSILLQVIVGGFAGSALLFRYAWDRIRGKVSGGSSADQLSEEDLHRLSGEMSVHRRSGEMSVSG